MPQILNHGNRSNSGEGCGAMTVTHFYRRCDLHQQVKRNLLNGFAKSLRNVLWVCETFYGFAGWQVRFRESLKPSGLQSPDSEWAYNVEHSEALTAGSALDLTLKKLAKGFWKTIKCIFGSREL